MKILLACPHCAAGAAQYVEMNYDGIYELTCPSGHHETIILPLQKFEILFQMGSLAFLDGYPREAALDFAAALERFFEFAIMVILNQQNLSQAEIDKTWKQLSHQSERQLGAFYMLYLHTFGKMPPLVENKWVSFRNSVAHRGELPNAEKTEAYAAYLWKYMINLLNELKEWKPEGIRRYVMAQSASHPQAFATATAVPTMISVLYDNATDSFADSLAVLQAKIDQGIFRK